MDLAVLAGDWEPYVPAVTTGRPLIGDAVIPRPVVVQRLRAADRGDPVLVTAPAGYGKTVATALWDEVDERPFAWVRLDYLDDDPVHLLLHIATAVVELQEPDGGVLRWLRGPGRAPLTDLVPVAVRLLEASGPMVLVLDDTHELSTPDAVRALQALVDAAPSSTTVALLGRCQLPLDLARRRLQQRIVDIGIDGLRFTRDEAAAALRSVSGVLDEATVAAGTDLCEGWPAGVMFVALALRDGAAIESLTSRNSVVVDYLVEEVLERVDDDTVTFLLESAVLDRFTAEQLDAVLGRDDSAQLLDLLSRSGSFFLISLDHQGVWFRYHHLFGDVLRKRLSAVGRGRVRHLASRASEVLERAGNIDGALGHALDAGDRARAAALVGREAVRLCFDGRGGVLARRLASLDAPTFAEHPDAAVARAWLGVTTGDSEVIQRSLVLAHRADTGRRLADGTPSVDVAVALIRSIIGVGGAHDVVRHADVVLAAGGNLVNPWWGAATVVKGAAEAMLGNVSHARTLLESALPVVDDLPGFQATALAHLALLDLEDGDDQAAVAHSDAARALADTCDLCDVIPMMAVYAVNAVMSARVGDSSGARKSVAITETLLDRMSELTGCTALLGHGLLAWTAAVLQDANLLDIHLDAADRARRRAFDAVALSQRVDRVRAMAAGVSRPLTAAERRLLPHLATHLSLRRIAEELVIGRETAKSQVTSIYRKLAVSSRADAVAEARRIGLLGD